MSARASVADGMRLRRESPVDTRRTGNRTANSTRTHVSQVQRSRILRGAISAFDQLGYTDTTVAQITGRAGISRRTFYDLFENREDCLVAVLEETVGQITAELGAAKLDDLRWRERMRAGLWVILCFFDREPLLARVCIVESARARGRVLECREAILGGLAALLDRGREESPRASVCPELTAEGLIGATLSILHTRLLGAQRQPLGDLLGELMGMIVLPYLGSAAARRECARPAPQIPTGAQPVYAPDGDQDSSPGIPMRLTYRTALVLEDVAARPGVSNRAVSEHVGITDQGQVSKLLARLERLGLLENTGEGHHSGTPNAWHLTSSGRQLTQSIQSNGGRGQPAAQDHENKHETSVLRDGGANNA